MTRRRKIVLFLTAVAAALALDWTFFGTLPPGPAHSRAKPDLSALPAFDVCWAEFGSDKGPGFFLSTGWSTTVAAQITVSSLVVRHPRGILMIDSGDSSKLAEEIAELPGAFDRLYMRLLPGGIKLFATAPQALKRLGIEPASLAGIVLTHAHVDHVGGVVDLPGVPVVLSPAEMDFVTSSSTRSNFHIFPAHARALAGRMKPIEWKNIPYEVFDQSADLFGDGSVVAVPLSGHTPGSIGVFVNISEDLRILHIGDTAMVKESYERPAGKGLVVSLLDLDRQATNRQLQLLKQLHQQVPKLIILPAHDRAVWREIFADAPCRGAH